MKSKNFFIVLLVLLVLVPNNVFASTDNTSVVTTQISNEILVKFKPGVSGYMENTIAGENGIVEAEAVDKLGVKSFKIPDGTTAEEYISKLSQDPNVDYVEPNHTYQVMAQTIPWGVTQVKADYAWPTLNDGSGVVVAVLDTGVRYTHEDLAGNMWTNTGEIAGNGIDDDGNGYVDDARGWDFVYNDNDPSDVHSHGTHVAGTIAAINNSVGVVGVAPGAKIMAVKVLGDTGSGSDVSIANGITYATDKGAKVINMSLGSNSYSTTMANAVAYAISKGVTVIAAAGNNNVSTPNYPAAYPNVVAVAATDSNDAKASFSNFGSYITVAAPGVNIYSTYNSSNTSYGTMSGTSMATPHVAGAAAILIQRYPGYSPAQIKQLLQDTADDLGTVGWDQYYGWGRINLSKGLQTVFQETDGSINWTGTWTPFSSSSASGGSIKYSMGSGGSSKTEDTSGSVTWTGTWTPFSSSSASGGSINYSTGTSGSSKTEDTSGSVTWTGTWTPYSSSSASGGSIKYSIGSGGASKTEDTSGSITWTGTWTPYSSSNASGGSIKYSTGGIDKVSFTFSGTSVTWYTTQWNNRGIAKVYIDGVLVDTVDLYSSGLIWQVAKTYSGLSAGSHTIVIENTGTKNASSSGTIVDVDAFGIPSSGTDKASFTFSGTSVTWYTTQWNNRGIAKVYIDGVLVDTVDLYSSGLIWQVAKTYSGLSAGSHTIVIENIGTKNASSSGTIVDVDAFGIPSSGTDKASFTFSGTSVIWYTTKSNNRGIAKVYIDGVLVDTVDLYGTLTWQVAKTYSGLSAGSHTIVIENTGTKNASSSGTIVDVDAFGIPSSGTDKASFTFSGTSVIWYTTKSNNRGIAKVYIDGVLVDTVDLYSAGVLWKFGKTYSGLSAGSHTIVVENTGTKNASSSGTIVDVDAFGIPSGTDKASFTFSGTAVTWYTTKSNNRGIAKVYIDGVLVDTVDLYSAGVLWKFGKTYSGLTAGSHTIVIENTGTKNAPSSGTIVDVDAFGVL